MRRAVKAAYRKVIGFMSFDNITYVYRAFQVWVWSILDKLSTSKENLSGLINSMYKLVTWCVGHVLLVNNPRAFSSHWISILQGHNQLENINVAYECVKQPLLFVKSAAVPYVLFYCLFKSCLCWIFIWSTEF